MASKLAALAAIDTIRALARDAHNTSIAAGFYSGKLTMGEQLMGIVTSVGDVARYVKRSKNLREVSVDKTGKPVGVPVIVANILITAFDFCEHAQIDIATALLDKLAWNKKQLRRSTQ